MRHTRIQVFLLQTLLHHKTIGFYPNCHNLKAFYHLATSFSTLLHLMKLYYHMFSCIATLFGRPWWNQTTVIRVKAGCSIIELTAYNFWQTVMVSNHVPVVQSHVHYLYANSLAEGVGFEPTMGFLPVESKSTAIPIRRSPYKALNNKKAYLW